MSSERMRQMKAKLPELFEQPGTVLYIGANAERFDASLELFEAGHEITVVEVWQPYIDELEEFAIGERAKHIFRGDVREIDKVELPHARFDWVVWLHGPEHLRRDEIQPTLEKLQRLAKRAIVLACPWGRYEQGAYRGNPFETHRSHLSLSDFEGFQTATLGRKNRRGSQILAWKWIS